MIINTNEKDSESKSIKIKNDTNKLFDTDKKNEEKIVNLDINHVECYSDNNKDTTYGDESIDSMLFNKSLLNGISEKEELKYLKEKTKNFNHKVRSPR